MISVTDVNAISGAANLIQAPIDNKSTDLNMSDVISSVANSAISSNESYNFISKVSEHLDKNYDLSKLSSGDLSNTQAALETFSVSTQFVAKAVSTLVKDVDSLVRMQ